jgi:hypothetical protein
VDIIDTIVHAAGKSTWKRRRIGSKRHVELLFTCYQFVRVRVG